MHVRESGVVVVVVVVCGWGGGAHPINEGFDGGGHEDAEKRLQDGERGHAGDGAGDLVQVAHEVVAQVQRDAQRLGSGQKARPGGSGAQVRRGLLTDGQHATVAVVASGHRRVQRGG